MSHYLVTGSAGFIGARTSTMLIEQGHTVVGIDNMNDAYDPRMKEYRLKKLQALKGFSFHKHDISEKSVIDLLRNEKLEAEIMHKSKELANTTLAIVKKNELLLEIRRMMIQQKRQRI